MNNLFRGLLAGAGAAKLGGGCFSTVLIFILLWVLLGQCGATLSPVTESTQHPEAVADLVVTQTAAPWRSAR